MNSTYTDLLEDIFTTLREFIFSESTLEKSRLKPSYFKRHRKLDFAHLLIFLLADFVGSLDTELREFFTRFLPEIQVMNEGDFSRARNHISEYPFKKMFEIVRDKYIEFEKKDAYYPYGLVWFGIDGSFLALPNFPKLANYFGSYGKANSSINARMSLVYDSLSHFIFEATLAPLRYSERELALNTIERLKSLIDLRRATFILDRGYPSLKFFEKLERLGTHFIIRSRENWYGLSDLEPGFGYNLIMDDYNYPLRVIKIIIPSGEVETLITNLFAPFPKAFVFLYYLRWPIEIEYYFLKRVFRLEDFNGYTINSIYQSFWIATTLSKGVVQIVRME